MVSDGTGRREFLRGAVGLGGSGVAALGVPAADSPALDSPASGSPALGVPGLDTDHSVRWTFELDSEGVVYPVARGRGLVVTVIRTYVADEETATDDGPTFEVVAFDAGSGAVQWRRTVDAQVSFPTVANGLVLVAGSSKLLALDAADGDRQWTVERDGLTPRGFVVDGGTVFVAGGTRTAAIDADTGQFRWTTDRRGNRFRQVLPGDGRVYVGSGRGFHALDRDSGTERWVVDVPTDAATWPAGVRDGVLVGWADGTVYGVDAEDGEHRWRTDLDGVGPYDAVGLVGDDAAYVTGERLTALDVRTGDVRWTYDTEHRGYSLQAVDGVLLFPLENGAFVAVDADSGREAWRFDTAQNHSYWGGATDGLAYVLGAEGLHVLDVESGREVWSLDVDGDPLWADVVGDLAFAVTDDGTLHAVDRPSPLATAPVATAREVATSPTGLGLLGLLGAGLLGASYRKLARDPGADAEDPAMEFGRLARLGGGPATEIHAKYVRTPDGPKLVAETRLTDGSYREAFERGVERWADLAASADGVLPVVDSGADEMPWVETPFVKGGSLADAWPLARRARVEVVSGVARALHAAHSEGVAHGALAPRHVFSGTPEGQERLRAHDVQVGGWFLADALPRDQDAGDPYAPPEDAEIDDEERDERGDLDAGVRADVYRIGALAHHLLAGEVPTPAGDSSAVEVGDSGDPEAGDFGAGDSGESDDSPESPASPVSDGSGDLADVLARALAADPAARYDSALAFDDAFRWAAIDR